MDELLLDVALLIGGFVLLVKGADWLVGGSASLARRWGVSVLVVGLTVVAWGTSAPEVVVSSMAAYKGDQGLAMGNVLGSNVANLGLVLGACALVLPRVMEKAPQLRESFWLMASLAALYWTVCDLEIDRMDGILLLGIFLTYNVQLYIGSRRGEIDPLQDLGEPDASGSQRPWRDVVLGSVSVAVGAKFVTDAAESMADEFGVSQRVIGLTVIAIGTSLPELAAGLGGAFKGEEDVSLGNVVGSNVFNVLAVIGIAALVAPFVPRGDGLGEELEHARDHDFLVVACFHFAAILVPRIGGERFGRWKGLVFLVAYVWYAWSQF